MTKNLTLCSLFDGSGSFPLAGMINGVEPISSSEVEPYPIRVTEMRLPEVKHYGDVSELKGGEIEPVDIITFGSPCQDVSLAGKRRGMSHSMKGDEDTTRSGLFFDAIRIICEMREKHEGKPRYAIYENVAGVFSSRDGDDFQRVLEEFAQVKDIKAEIPKMESWPKAGEIKGSDYSIAWRTLDAQYWGVPQRRKRIYLVADFDGHNAGRILFESEGKSFYSKEHQKIWRELKKTGTAEEIVKAYKENL